MPHRIEPVPPGTTGSNPPPLGPQAETLLEPPREPRRVPLAIEDWLTVLIMAALALITFANVLTRYFTNTSFAWTEEISVFLMIEPATIASTIITNTSFAWTEEISVFLMIVLAMVAGSAAVARDRHIRIEFFSARGSARRQRRLALFGAAMVALLFALMTALSIRLVWDDWRYGETSPGIGVPQWWYSIWLPVFSALICARAVGLLRRRSRQPDAAFLNSTRAPVAEPVAETHAGAAAHPERRP